MSEPIQDKAPKPAGVLPRHVQSWFILGLAVLMVLIMWLTGGKHPPVPSKTSSPLGSPTAQFEVNEAKIAELQNRIQQLQREQAVAQNALAQQSRYLPAPSGNSSAGASKSSPANGERTDDAIEAERKRRDYLSLFASNVAVSYRKNPVPPSAAEPASARSESQFAVPTLPVSIVLAALFKRMPPPPPPQTAPASPPGSTSASSANDGSETKDAPHPAAAPAASAAAGKSYVLFEGTLLDSVLVNRLDGAMPGPIECLLTNDVYSHDRQRVLIPAGSKVLGETRRVDSFGQTRLAVAFHRLLMPDGYSVSLDQFKGLNQAGDAGLRDQVNNHYFRIFGTSLALGVIGAAGEATTGTVLTGSGTDRLREGFGQSLAQSSEHILDHFLNLLPTVTIREGHRVKIYLSGDLALPEYSAHHLPSDL